jgi:hypothetical protein
MLRCRCFSERPRLPPYSSQPVHPARLLVGCPRADSPRSGVTAARIAPATRRAQHTDATEQLTRRRRRHLPLRAPIGGPNPAATGLLFALHLLLRDVADPHTASTVITQHTIQLVREAGCVAAAVATRGAVDAERVSGNCRACGWKTGTATSSHDGWTGGYRVGDSARLACIMV